MKLDIRVALHNVKNIESFDYTFSFEPGIYALVGENAVGKSTIMAAIASTIYPKILSQYGKTEVMQDSHITISCQGKTDTWKYNKDSLHLKRETPSIFSTGFMKEVFLRAHALRI